MTNDETTDVIDLITGRWRSQIVFAGTALGVFDALDDKHGRTAAHLAGLLGVDGPALARLMRALGSVGLLKESPQGHFRLTSRGTCLRAEHPGSLRAMVLLEEGPVHYAAWRHLAEIVRSGSADGFRREFGMPYWQYLKRDLVSARSFSEAMSSYSAGEAPALRHCLRDDDFGSAVLCDVGGSHGALLAEVLQDHPEARGIVFDLPEVIATRHVIDERAPRPLEYVGGDMFDRVPPADVYLLKHILHDWSDDDCLRILSAIRAAAKPEGRLYLCEFVVPGAAEAHFAKLFDIHMMVVQDGRQRTIDELEILLTKTGWRPGVLRPLEGSPMSVLEAGA